MQPCMIAPLRVMDPFAAAAGPGAAGDMPLPAPPARGAGAGFPTGSGPGCCGTAGLIGDCCAMAVDDADSPFGSATPFAFWPAAAAAPPRAAAAAAPAWPAQPPAVECAAAGGDALAALLTLCAPLQRPQPQPPQAGGPFSQQQARCWDADLSPLEEGWEALQAQDSGGSAASSACCVTLLDDAPRSAGAPPPPPPPAAQQHPLLLALQQQRGRLALAPQQQQQQQQGGDVWAWVKQAPAALELAPVRLPPPQQQQQQQQQQWRLAAPRGAAAARPAAPLAPAPAPRAPPGAPPLERALAWAGGVLGVDCADVFLFARHVWARTGGRADELLIASLGARAPPHDVAVLVCLWLASKLEGNRRAVAGAGRLCAATGLSGWGVTSVEVHILQLTEFSPYRGW
ncbi:MAG: hypothetical protein J3K34DRAFT_523393 [Monoraphidium minutum]|nr:MAG: hypothetical protein J3K34DRAFT_523393 [Monoraphidium minutum]